MRLVALVISACLLAACAPDSTAKTSPKHTPIAGAPDPTPDPSPQAAPPHLFLIPIQNRSHSQPIPNAYVSSLAPPDAVAPDHHALSHPSLPTYLALTPAT